MSTQIRILNRILFLHESALRSHEVTEAALSRGIQDSVHTDPDETYAVLKMSVIM